MEGQGLSIGFDTNRYQLMSLFSSSLLSHVQQFNTVIMDSELCGSCRRLVTWVTFPFSTVAETESSEQFFDTEKTEIGHFQ